MGTDDATTARFGSISDALTVKPLSSDEWLERYNAAAHRVIVANVANHEGKAALDLAVDAYIEARDEWRDAAAELERLESYRPTPDGRVAPE